MNNLIDKHIKNTQKKLKKYNSIILKSKNDKEITDELVQTYIDARYYNCDTDETIKTFYKRIYDALKRKSDALIKKEPRKKELIDSTLAIFQYYFYFDFVRNTNDLDKIVDSIAEKRIFKLNIRAAVDDKEFNKELLNLVKLDIKEVKEMLVSYNSKDFSLNQKKFQGENNYINISLNYSFEVPELFSEEIIEETYNNGLIAEDKLFVEYTLLALETLKDILNGNFEKIYVCDFAATLFSKKTKLNQVLDIINNQAAQDKIYLKINYIDFLDNKEQVFEMIRNGFKFAVVTDNDMPRFSSDELKIFEIFPCVIVNKDDMNKYKNVKILHE